MSRFDSDLDAADWREGPYPHFNATCAECGDPFTKGRDDIGSLCDGCCTERDAQRDIHTARMAKASAPLTQKKGAA